ncbi:MAG TPA: CoA transferase [Thermoanaerobaculia bacterium]|nr:CoA transferase [Thermoanaerobaculia bacterium]
MNEPRGPLAGLFVLDLSRVLAGPFCTMLLGDLGARVIKIEHPDGGDVTRGWGPPFEETTGLSAYYLAVNRNKESIALDLSTAPGAESLRILSRRADVLVENFLPGALEKLGLPLESLRRENERLVTASITGFGRRGEDAALPGFDLLAQAGAGLMGITGTAEPAKVGVAVSDLFAGLFALAGVLARIRERDTTGRGGHVEVDLFTSTLASLINVAQASLVTGMEAKRWGNSHPQIVPYRPFAASDGELVVAAGTDRQFARLCDVVGLRGWAEDPRFRTNAARVENREVLESRLAEILATSGRDGWIAACRAAGIPCGPVRGPFEALSSATARALGAVVSASGVDFVASPIHLGVPAPIRFPPGLDEHGEALRREFGLPPGIPRSGSDEESHR